MAELPTGTVTFLFTDLEGSTRLWEEHSKAMRAALARHDAVLRDAVEQRDGVVVKTTGDGLFAAFAVARDALAAAVDAQLALEGEDWALPDPLRVRMGLHTGGADVRAGDYYGPAVNRAARVSAAGHGGQILVSHATEELVRDDLPNGAGLVDLGEKRLRDLERPERIFQVTHAGLASEFAPVRSLDAYPTNLPGQRTSFVGREREVADVTAALTSARLVTLTGVGGVGKTRLALQVAAEVLPHRADGVWLCELAPVSEPESVLDAVANAVRATSGATATGAGLPVRDVLVRHLARRDALVVLDNCEQLLAAVAEVVDDLLNRCPGVTVLATSREGLGLAGEQIVAVGTLGVPAADAGTDAARAGDAVQLFADRASAAKRDFALSDDNISAVVEVCRRLDGIPLAIELAAARTQMFTPAQIAERLDERFRLLTGSLRGTASRHQTLRAAIDWSYDQLDATERSVLARLAVFPGDFDFDAAEAVATGGDVDARSVLDVLGQLVGKSLVVATDASDVMSFRLLETIRQYAEERLEDAGEIADTRTRHAYHYLACIEHAAATKGDTLAHVIGETMANMLAAHEWFVACADADGALRTTLPSLQTMTGLSPLVAANMAAASLDVPGAMGHPLAPSVMAARASVSLMVGADALEALATAQQSLALADELGVEPNAQQLVDVATVTLRSGHLEEACDLAQRSAEVAARAGDDWAAAVAYQLLSASQRYRGSVDAAADAGARAEEAARRSGGRELLAGALLVQGYALLDVEPERALALLDEGARDARSVSPDSLVAAWCLANAGLIRLRLGDPAGARRDFNEVFDLGTRLDVHDVVAHACAQLVIGLLDIGDSTDAPVAAQLLAATEQVLTPVALYAGLGTRGAELAARLEAILGAETLTDLRARGAALDFDATVTLARSALARVTEEGR